MNSVICLGLAMFFVGGLMGVPGAMADDFRSQCVQDANAVFEECRTVCREDLQAAKDECRNVPHECADVCRDTRDQCVDQAIDDLEACLSPCNTDLLAAKDTCRTVNDQDPAALDQCIDTAQVIAFVCRDQCRESFRLASALKECGKSFRGCIKNCLKPTP